MRLLGRVLVVSLILGALAFDLGVSLVRGNTPACVGPPEEPRSDEVLDNAQYDANLGVVIMTWQLSDGVKLLTFRHLTSFEDMDNWPFIYQVFSLEGALLGWWVDLGGGVLNEARGVCDEMRRYYP